MKLFNIFFSFFAALDAYKVLVFNPAFGASHSNFMGKISDILIDAGHDVTMLIPEFFESKKSLVGSKKVTKIVKIEQDERALKLHKEIGAEEIMRKQIWNISGDLFSFAGMITNFSISCSYQCENIFRQTAILNELREEKFDLGISEALFICGYAVFDYIGIETTINAESIIHMDIVKTAMGEPSSTSYFPGVFSSLNDEMGIVGRAKNLAGTLFSNYFTYHRYALEIETVKKYFENVKPWNEYIDKFAFNMINSNQYLDYASPTLPKTVFIGGMQVTTKSEKEIKLSKYWDQVLSIRKNNVLISFGSNAYSSDMPEQFKESFLKVFRNLPDTTFIWKYEKENSSLANDLENVILTKWMPQNDLLSDRRLSLFVTHGGLGSSIELAYQGKPALVIPLMADQPRNAKMLSRHGGVLEFQKSDLDKPEMLQNAIETILYTESFQMNAQRLGSILQSQPYQPKDVVLKHCDFAVRFGSLDTMNSHGRFLNVLQFYSIDIWVLLTILVIIIFLIVFVSCKCIKKLIWKTCGNKNKLE